MTFEQALQANNEGKRVIRKVWKENGIPKPNFHDGYYITKEDAEADDWLCYDKQEFENILSEVDTNESTHIK